MSNVRDNQDSKPAVRFKGFSDAWEQRKLGDVVGEIQSGNRLPKDSLTSGNIPYVVAQTKNEGVFKTISEKTLDYNGNPMKLFPGNSISFSIDNPEAMFYRSTEFYTSNIMRVIHAGYLSHQQYLFILENMKRFTRRYDWSHKFSGPVVSNLEYLQPNEQEQCKIGSFILAFDNIIALHQRKVENLQKLKKSLLQQMFVSGNDQVPKIRFKGFSDAWEKRYLGDYVVDYTEKTTQENQFPVLTSSQQQGIVLQSEYFSDRQVTTDENIGYFVLPRGYFTYRSRSDNNIFVFNRNDIIDKGIISYFYPVFGLINVDSNFFLRRINNGLNRQLAIAAEGTGQHVLSLKKFKKMETRFPSLPEQKQIGEFLECLDDLITVNQRKVENLQKLKKSLLRLMFI
jgi:type I restriction enzyme S subunit